MVWDGVGAKLGNPEPTSAATASAGARPEMNFVSSASTPTGKDNQSKCVVVFSPVRMRTANPARQDLAVADLPGARRPAMIASITLSSRPRGAERDLYLQFGQKLTAYSAPRVRSPCALLSAVALYLRDRQPVANPDRGQRVTDLLEFERLHHRHHNFHVNAPEYGGPTRDLGVGPRPSLRLKRNAPERRAPLQRLPSSAARPTAMKRCKNKVEWACRMRNALASVRLCA